MSIETMNRKTKSTQAKSASGRVTQAVGVCLAVSCLSVQGTAYSSPVNANPKLSVKGRADAKPKRIIFTSPWFDAKTIQVTEVWFQINPANATAGAMHALDFGPMLKTGTVTIHLQLPADPTSEDWNTRVDWTESNPSKPAAYWIEAGKASAYFADGKFQKTPNSGGLWHDPLMQLIVGLNSHREEIWAQAVSTVPAVREGRAVLLDVDTSGNDPRNTKGLMPKMYSEGWYDPTTHLPIRFSTFSVFHGKTQEINRIEYSEWLLNQPMPSSLFAIPPGAVKEP